MKILCINKVFCLLFILAGVIDTFAQVSGNISYDNIRRKNQNYYGVTHNVALTDSALLIQAKLLMNTLADEYVAVFGVAQEGKTIDECHTKIDTRINGFLSAIQKLGISTTDYYVDFINQNRIYNFEISGNNAYEKLEGFELKKNISIHYKDKTLIDKLTKTASQFQIYDLIKVDYLVLDIAKVKNELFQEAVKLINEKKKKYVLATNVKLLPESQIYSENFASLTPSDLYDSYSAYESGEVDTYYQSRTTTIKQRKMKTFYFNPITQSGFDLIINPVIIEPVVQFTYTLQIKYEIDKN